MKKGHKMKKIIIVFILCMLPISFGEDVEVEIPDFDVVIYNQRILKTSTYPVFMYKGITYIPLTSDINKGLGLNAVFNGALHLTKVTPSLFDQNFINGDYEEGQYLVAQTLPFDVYYNGLIEDDYPILFYKSVTYLPMTWSLAHDAFEWHYRFDGNLYINSDDKQILDLERFILTPGKDNTSLSITFTMSEYYDELKCLIDYRTFDINKEAISVNENGHINYSYSVTCDDLKPGTSYEVTIFSDTHQYIKEISTLGASEIKMAFIGDIQGYKMTNYDGFKETLDYVDSHNVDLIYLAGDIVDTGDKWQEWRYFEQTLVGRNDMFITCIGNHDVKGSPDIYDKTFTYPENGLISNRSFYIDLPFARIGVWDTESYSTFEDQSEWLENVMDIDKFKVILMHRSVYPISYNESHIRNLHQVFDKVGIDLVLSGHDHIYSRTMMKNGHRDDNGTVYIVGGSGSGSKFYNQVDTRSWSYIVYDDNQPVYTIIDIKENIIDIKAYHKEVIIDEYQIKKK